MPRQSNSGRILLSVLVLVSVVAGVLKSQPAVLAGLDLVGLARVQLCPVRGGGSAPSSTTYLPGYTQLDGRVGRLPHSTPFMSDGTPGRHANNTRPDRRHRRPP